MSMKRALLFSVAVGFVAWIDPAAAVPRSDNPALCASFQQEWVALAQHGGVQDVSRFRGEVPVLCPMTANAVDGRLSELRQREVADAQRREVLVSQQATNAAAARELREANEAANRERVLRVQAEQEASNLRRIREAELAAASIPGRARNLWACSISQDIARLDQGTMPNVRFDDVVVPPEVHVVYDIADAAQGAVDVYSWDINERQWTRSRLAASRVGNLLTVGATSENEQNVRILNRAVLDLDALTVIGAGFVEPISTGGGSVANLDFSTGQLNLNPNEIFRRTQRPPRLWLETRGACAQSNAPPSPLTSTPTWHTTVREIPTIPPMPRR
ncbi:MAG: hypothetical protein WDM79_15180 [Terricaulis sp.]